MKEPYFYTMELKDEFAEKATPWKTPEEYQDEIRQWAEFDARQVVSRSDTRAKWANIRLDILADSKNPLFAKEPELAKKFYYDYIELLNQEIQKLNGGVTSYGTIPEFHFSKEKRRADRKFVIS